MNLSELLIFIFPPMQNLHMNFNKGLTVKPFQTQQIVHYLLFTEDKMEPVSYYCIFIHQPQMTPEKKKKKTSGNVPYILNDCINDCINDESLLLIRIVAYNA